MHKTLVQCLKHAFKFIKRGCEKDKVSAFKKSKHILITSHALQILFVYSFFFTLLSGLPSGNPVFACLRYELWVNPWGKVCRDVDLWKVVRKSSRWTHSHFMLCHRDSPKPSWSYRERASKSVILWGWRLGLGLSLLKCKISCLHYISLSQKLANHIQTLLYTDISDTRIFLALSALP